MALEQPINGTEGGGSGFAPIRICPGGQTQQQVDPKQQQQQPVQSGIQIGYSQQNRPTAIFPRPSPRLNAPRPTAHMISQPLQNTNLQYSAPTAMLIPPAFPQTVIIPHTSLPGGRHQSHGGGQGGGGGGAPTGPYYAPAQPQQIYTVPPHHAMQTTYQYPYLYSMRNAQGFPAQNPGPHPGAAAPQPPPHQPQQQFVVDSGVRGGGQGGGGGGVGGQGGGVIIPPPLQPQQPAQQQPRVRRSHAIPIVHPSSGKDISDEFYSETNSGESTASVTPLSFPHNERDDQAVAAEFAAKVAAAVAPAEAHPSVASSHQGSVNGPSSPPPAPTATVSPPISMADLHPPPATVIPPPTAHPPHQPHIPIQTIPTIPHLQPTHPQAQIPTVSAKTDSPPVELPRPKGPTHSPGRKSTPIPSSVQPVLDNKKKEKKVTGLGSTLPPHKEEVVVERKSVFAEEFNIKNLQPVLPSPVAIPPPITVPIIAPSLQSTEPETNGESDVVSPPPSVASAPVSAPAGGKHHDKVEQQAHHQSSHDRGKTLPKKGGKGKKAGGVKEQRQRWLDKEGGSEMDAFTSAGPPAAPASTNELAASPPPSEPQSVEPPAPSPAQQPSAPAPQPPVLASQPVTVPDRQPSPQPPPPQQPVAPVPQKSIQNEEEPEEMEEDEEIDEESLIVAAKNEENTKVSAVAAAEDEEEDLSNETSVIDQSKPSLKYNYKEGQWSPLNPEGKKVYDRDFLLILRSDDLSTKRPDIEDCDIIKTDSTNNNSISANNNNNNRRPLHSSNSLVMNRGESFAPNFFTKSSSSQRGGSGMIGKRGSQQGRPIRDSRDNRNKGYPSQQYKDALDGELHWASKGGGWKPERCKTPPKATSDEDLKTANLYKRVRGILNKLTPQKFDTLMEQILSLPIDSIERLTGVVGLVIDKAVDEPSFSRAYAKLCQNLNKIAIKTGDGEGVQQVAGDVSFRKILLTKCQHMFEKKKREEKEGDDGKKSEEERIAELQQQIAEEVEKDKKKELQLVLEEEERKIRVKYVGLARFIGELFKLNMLTPKIMFGCITTLLEKIEEESLECLCKLLTTVGKELEQQTKARELDEYFNKMKKLSQKSSNSKVSSRVRFMLQDVIELRLNKWVPRREDNNPKTMDQIQRDAERETLMESAFLQSSNTPRSKHNDRNDDRRRGGPRGGGGGGGGNIQDSDGWMISANKFRHVTFEASKLQHLKDIEPSSQNLGSSGQFRQWHQGSAGSKTQQNSVESRRHEYSMPNKYALLGDDKKPAPPMMSNRKSTASSLEKERAVQSVRDVLTSDRTSRNQSSNPSSRDSSQARSSTKPSVPQTPKAAEPEEPPTAVEEQEKTVDPEVLKKKSNVLFEEWVANHNVVESIDSIKEAFQEPIVFVKFVMEKVLEDKEPLRIAFSELLSILLEKSVIAGEDVAKEFRMLIEIGDDLAIDIPFVWKILGQMLAPPMVKGVFTFADLKVACEGVRTSNLSITTAEIINKLLKEKGPVFIKAQWETSKVEFSDFIPEDDVKVFIKNNSFGFIIGDGEIEAKEPIISMHDVENKLYDFLSQDGDKVFDHVCEWVKANVGSKSQDADFIKALMRAVIKVCTKNEKIVPASLNKHSTLIKKFLDANEMKELACLDGVMDVVVNDMESPVGLLLDVFQILNDNNIISIEAFLKWKIHGNNERGKGVALACLAAFFVSISEQVSETDEEST